MNSPLLALRAECHPNKASAFADKKGLSYAREGGHSAAGYKAANSFAVCLRNISCYSTITSLPNANGTGRVPGLWFLGRFLP